MHNFSHHGNETHAIGPRQRAESTGGLQIDWIVLPMGPLFLQYVLRKLEERLQVFGHLVCHFVFTFNIRERIEAGSQPIRPPRVGRGHAQFAARHGVANVVFRHQDARFELVHVNARPLRPRVDHHAVLRSVLDLGAALVLMVFVMMMTMMMMPMPDFFGMHHLGQPWIRLMRA